MLAKHLRCTRHHQPRKQRNMLRLIRVLQSENRSARSIVIQQRSKGTIEGGWARLTGKTQTLVLDIALERKGASSAKRLRRKTQIGKARMAESRLVRNGRLAARTQRRQQEVQRTSRHPLAQAAAGREAEAEKSIARKSKRQNLSPPSCAGGATQAGELIG